MADVHPVEPLDPARIRLVTSRFRELQGLRTVALHAALILVFWSSGYGEWLGGFGPLGMVAAFTAILVAPVIGIYIANVALAEYYASRFGKVKVSASSRWKEEGPGVVLLVGAVVVDSAKMGTSTPSAVLIAGALISLYIVMRDWPWRGYHLLAAAGCLVGAAMTAAVPVMRIDNMPELLRVSFTILLGLTAITGYLDHRLLVATMGRGSQDAGAEAAHAEAR